MEPAAFMSEVRLEAAVIEACRQGDRQAFRLLYERYKDVVFSMALYSLHGDRAAAEDVSQEVFLKVFSHIGGFRGQSTFDTWLYRLVANCCVDEHRRSRRLVVGSPESADPPANPPDCSRDSEIADEVKAAVADLSPKLRIPIMLKYFEELSYEEIARALRCSKGTVASRLNRGHKALARRLAHLRPALTSGE